MKEELTENKIEILVPASINWLNLCTNVSQKRIESYKIILDIIQYCWYIGKRNEISESNTDDFQNGWKCIGSSVFTNIFNTKEYIKIVREMENLKLIERNNYFIIGEQSKKWRINQIYYTGKRNELERYEIKDEKLSKKFYESFRVNNFKTDDVGKELFNALTQIRVNNIVLDEKRMYEDTIEIDFDGDIENFNRTRDALIDIINHQYRFKRDIYGRLHTNITNLKKCVRRYLYFKGHKNETLHMIDIKNSQPFIFSLLFNKNFIENIEIEKILIEYNMLDIVKNFKITEIVKQYIKAVESGKLYEEFVNKNNNRDKIKKKFMSFFFGNPDDQTGKNYQSNKKTIMYELFENRFPDVLDYMVELKNHKYEDFSRCMQRIESYIIIDNISKKIMKTNNLNIFTTIHDSFLFIQSYENIEIVNKAIKETCLELNINMPKLSYDQV